jgi:hypothetical protein
MTTITDLVYRLLLDDVLYISPSLRETAPVEFAAKRYAPDHRA